MEKELKQEAKIDKSKTIYSNSLQNYRETKTFHNYFVEEIKILKGLKAKFYQILAENYCKKESENFIEFGDLSNKKIKEFVNQADYDDSLKVLENCHKKYNAYIKPLDVFIDNLKKNKMLEPHKKMYDCTSPCTAYYIIGTIDENKLYQCYSDCFNKSVEYFDEYIFTIKEMVEDGLDDIKNKRI